MFPNQQQLFSNLQQLGYTGTINDMMYSFLLDELGLTGNQYALPDLLQRYFVSYGYTTGTLGDLLYNPGFPLTPFPFFLLLESGGYLLKEDAFRIELE